MTDPTVEEVREAVRLVEMMNSPIERFRKGTTTVLAAARAWLDAPEPDIEAAIKALGRFWYKDIPLPNQRVYEEEARIAVAAAFGDNTLIRRADR